MLIDEFICRAATYDAQDILTYIYDSIIVTRNHI